MCTGIYVPNGFCSEDLLQENIKRGWSMYKDKFWIGRNLVMAEKCVQQDLLGCR